MSTSKDKAGKVNYFIRSGADGVRTLARCSPPAGYATLAAAKEAEIRELNEEISYP